MRIYCSCGHEYETRTVSCGITGCLVPHTDPGSYVCPVCEAVNSPKGAEYKSQYSAADDLEVFIEEVNIPSRSIAPRIGKNVTHHYYSKSEEPLMKKHQFLMSAAKPLTNSAVEYPELVYLTVLNRVVLAELLTLHEMARALAAKHDTFVEIRDHVPNVKELVVLPGEWMLLQHPALMKMTESPTYDPNSGYLIELTDEELDEVHRMALDVDTNRYACNTHMTWEFSLTGESPARVHTISFMEMLDLMAVTRSKW